MKQASNDALPARWQEAHALRTLATVVAEGPTPAAHARAQSPNLLGASNDVEAAKAFLAEYSATPATLRSYTKEVERLLLWLLLRRKVSLAELTRADLAAFGAFLADPQPRSQWCGPKRGRLCPRYSEHWRPFVGPLTPSAQRSALVIVNVFLRYLVAGQYIPANPLALMRRQAMRQSHELTASAQVAERVLSTSQWEAVTQVLAPRMAPPPGADFTQAPWAAARYAARERFVVALSYFLALRIGELTSHTMGHFRCVRGLWQFYVVGKGSKAASVPVNDALLAELRAFRAWLLLPALPAPKEPTPLVPRLSGEAAPVTARRVHQLLHQLFLRAAHHIEGNSPVQAAHLRRASPHWLRHTSLTKQVEAGLSLAEVKANARHSKMDTTMLYVHAEQDARHDSMQRHVWDGQQQQPQPLEPKAPLGQA